jgi:hypothetical protein
MDWHVLQPIVAMPALLDPRIHGGGIPVEMDISNYIEKILALFVNEA